MKSRLFAPALLAAGLSVALAAGDTRAQQAADAPAFQPRVDHHQHLLSPQGAAVLYALTEADDMPDGIAGLLQAREGAWDDATALRALYTEDATRLDVDAGAWTQGRDAVAARTADTFGSAYDIVPVAVARTVDGARVFGFYTRGRDETLRKVGYVTFDLKDAEDGWRIASEQPMFPGPQPEAPIDADALIAALDEAGIRKAVVLSVGYWFQEQEGAMVGTERALREDRWTAEQAARYPDRLVAFCSLNPLHPGAAASLAQCKSDKRFKGIKMHFASSDLDLTEPDHQAKVRRVLQEANAAGLPVVMHVRGGADYGAAHARVLLDEILPVAPDIVVQVAHLWGGGAFSAEAMMAFATAVEAGHPATRNLYFDVTDAALIASTPEQLQQVATAIRMIGPERVLYGSDMTIQGHPDAAAGARAFRERVPLEPREFAIIEANVAPYLR